MKLFLRRFNCASVGKQINFDCIKMHGVYVDKKEPVSLKVIQWLL